MVMHVAHEKCCIAPGCDLPRHVFDDEGGVIDDVGRAAPFGQHSILMGK